MRQKLKPCKMASPKKAAHLREQPFLASFQLRWLKITPVVASLANLAASMFTNAPLSLRSLCFGWSHGFARIQAGFAGKRFVALFA